VEHETKAAQPMAYLAITARQKEHQHHMLSRTATTSVAGRATAMRRLRRRASATSISTSGGRLYCRTNGCPSFLEIDPITGTPTCPICGYTARTH
jgi:hypothetical protein